MHTHKHTQCAQCCNISISRSAGQLCIFLLRTVNNSYCTVSMFSWDAKPDGMDTRLANIKIIYTWTYKSILYHSDPWWGSDSATCKKFSGSITSAPKVKISSAVHYSSGSGQYIGTVDICQSEVKGQTREGKDQQAAIVCSVGRCLQWLS